MKSSAPAKGEELHAFFEEVFRLHGVLAQGMDRVHEESGLRTPQRRLAETLEQEGQMTVPHAAAELEVSRQFVQTTCNDLASLGLVEFFDNPRHKRSRLVSLTKQGLAALARARREEARIHRVGPALGGRPSPAQGHGAAPPAARGAARRPGGLGTTCRGRVVGEWDAQGFWCITWYYPASARRRWDKGRCHGGTERMPLVAGLHL